VTPGDLDEALRALSHAERRRFLAACRAGPKAAGELAEASALSLATVSEHLKVLRKSGLVRLTVQGRFWMYRTDSARLDMVLTALTGGLHGTRS
jgi:DNA-binding transcriptional ArsR family regulator